MRRLIAWILLAHVWTLPTFSLAATYREICAERERLENQFEKLCEEEFEFLQRNRQQSLLFLAGHHFEPGEEDAKRKRLAGLLSDKFLKLAKLAVEADEPTLAYQLLHEAMYFGNQPAERVVGIESKEPRVRLATITHPKLLWKRRDYFQISTDHFQVITKNEAEGVKLARRLETLHSVWRQVFFECWSSKLRLQSSLKREKLLVPRSGKSRRHRVVLFDDRVAYVEHLRTLQPRIDITLGFYDIASRTSYFFSGPDSSIATQFHEVTHQLFQEVRRSSAPLAFRKNFWAVEGVAMYMESLRTIGPVATIGGLHADRLQFARYRRLQEKFYVPVEELVGFGRNDLQRDERIRRIYSQSAGLTHFLMDGEAGKHRDGFIQYLRKIYAGRDQTSSLAESINNSNERTDDAYARFLTVEDSDLMEAKLPANSIKSLCWGDTQITDAALLQIGEQAELNWLDLARTRTTDRGFEFLKHTKALRQVSFDGTQATDATIKLLKQNVGLEELDLANTAITDESAEELSQMSALKILWLSNTAVTDETLKRLGELRSLEFLDVGGTQVTGTGRDGLRKKLPNLTIEPAN